jgi:hypothetical protein
MIYIGHHAAPCPLLFLLGLCLVVGTETVQAESPAPSVHWGALAYPDQYRTLDAGVTFNRFTEFSAHDRYNSTIRETMGFNFATLSWTERFSDWGTNLTVGAGPTRDEPTETFQNGFIHRAFGFSPVPSGAVREATDFMIDGSLTRWAQLFGQHDSGFAGLGASSGTLYHEGFARLGARRLSFGLPFIRLSAWAAIASFITARPLIRWPVNLILDRLRWVSPITQVMEKANGPVGNWSWG